MGVDPCAAGACDGLPAHGWPREEAFRDCAPYVRDRRNRVPVPSPVGVPIPFRGTDIAQLAMPRPKAPAVLNKARVTATAAPAPSAARSAPRVAACPRAAASPRAPARPTAAARLLVLLLAVLLSDDSK